MSYLAKKKFQNNLKKNTLFSKGENFSKILKSIITNKTNNRF